MKLFNSDEIHKITKILTLIIPSSSKGMPDAGLILQSIELDNSNHARFVEMSKVICVRIGLNEIQNEEDLIQFKKENFRDFSVFVNMVLILYYSNKTVLKKLEIGSFPPFPDGNFVKEGDIYLLEQVYLKEKMYRVT